MYVGGIGRWLIAYFGGVVVFTKVVVECLFVGEGFNVSSLIGEYEF
jgi:hypothetical protein